ncbi:hypothetical protein A2501_01945 [Candidatus Uhrbacteria bacterium RIFOXYC12_FULL_57_11]|nr:MAG: hypothetical protein A2501_01945 [Candidatus Uhrbacteria bacterium RIFOXYC12_FULL_57_11]
MAKSDIVAVRNNKEAEMDFRSIRSRKGFTMVELMIVVALGGIAIVAIVVGLLLWGWGKASTEVIGANRAYDAVAAAHYVEPELIATYEERNLATFCFAKDDVIGYGMAATPANGGGKMLVTVCCPTALSSRPCTVH